MVHLRKRNIHNSTVPDRMHPRELKKLAGISVTPLCVVFENSWQSDEIFWKTGEKANVMPVFRKGRKKDPGNCTVISFTTVTEGYGRCLPGSYIMANHAWPAWLSSVVRWVDDGRAIDTIFFDYSRAFDTVPHCILLIKLGRYGLDSGLLAWWRTGSTAWLR